MPIGPQLPPSVEKRKRSNGSGTDKDEKDTDNSTRSYEEKADHSDTDANTVKKARIVGPTLPPGLADKAPALADGSESSSDDDDFGPSLPTTVASTSQGTKSTTPNKNAPASSSGPDPVRAQRDEWMTLAPSSGDWSQRIDPTKLKNRKFNTSKSNALSASGTDSWHETAEQKQARLQREVLGLKGQQSAQPPTSKSSIPSNDETTTSGRLKNYSAQRGPSLYEAHQKGKKDEQDDDPSARAFDREKDIAGAPQINGTQRREMLQKSANFNSRFSSAKYL